MLSVNGVSSARGHSWRARTTLTSVASTAITDPIHKNPISPRTRPKVLVIDEVLTSTRSTYAAPPSWRSCQSTARVKPPGAARQKECWPVAARRNRKVRPVPTTRIVSSGRTSLIPVPMTWVNTSVVLATVETIVTASSENPAVSSRPRVFSRA